MNALVNNLVKILAQFHPVLPEVKSFLVQNCRTLKVKKGGFLLQPGEICDKYYFVHRGVVRAYIQKEEREITTWISAANEMVTSIYSMQERVPSIEYIQAIRESVLLELDALQVENLLLDVPEFNILMRKLVVSYYRDAEIRSFIARMPSAVERCQFYLNTYPEKALIVPKKYIASFLGIREETLSRVIKKTRSQLDPES